MARTMRAVVLRKPGLVENLEIMEKRVLFIHGAGQGAYEADGILVASLQHALDPAYAVRYPKKTNEESPEYVEM